MATILFRERSFALIVAATEGQSTLFLQDIKRELEESEEIAALFGKIHFREKDSSTDIIGTFADGEQFRIMAKGAGQQLRGLKWNNKRPDLIVIDDLEDDEAVMNKDRREKMRRWFYSALLPCMSAHGIIRMVGTILHMDSLLENLLPKQRETNAINTPLACKRPRPIAGWMSVRYRAHDPSYKHILWPSRFPEEKLRDIKSDYVSKGLSDSYSQEYLNNPIDESLAFFRREDMLPIGESELEDIENGNKPLNYYIACDLAISESERADYTVFVVAGVDSTGMMYIFDIVRDRMDSRAIIDTAIALQQRYDPEIFTFEQGAIEKSIGPFLREEMIRTGVYLNVNKMLPTKDKQARARSLQARMRAGRVKFNKEAWWYMSYEDEMLRFPRDTHDDQVDATSWLGLTLDKLVEAPTIEELDEDELEEQMRMYGFANSGRNKHTGY